MKLVPRLKRLESGSRIYEVCTDPGAIADSVTAQRVEIEMAKRIFRGQPFISREPIEGGRNLEGERPPKFKSLPHRRSRPHHFSLPPVLGK